MLKRRNIFIILVLFILLGGVTAWNFLFKDIDVKIKNDIQSGKSVVLLFSAKWCGSCEKQKPIYEKIKNEFPEIHFYLVGSELNKIKQKLLFKYYNIKGLPTFVIFKDAKEQTRLIGLQTEEKLREAFLNK